MSLVLLSLLISTASAKDFGIHGPVYTIDEHNPIEVIQERLKNMNPTDLETVMAHSIDEKKLCAPLKGWAPTTHPRTFQYDPTYVVPQDIKDHTGRVLFKQGERVNPLALQPLEKTLLFIDGRDDAQVDWALHTLSPSTTIILVAGSPKDLMKAHKKPFSFDQKGHLLKTFGIQQIPAMVTISKGEVWIKECKLEDEND